MIEILNGIHETVAYDAFNGIRIHHNKNTENFPLHWHTAMEIIMPYRNEYTVAIGGTPHTWSAVLSYDYSMANASGNLADTVRTIFIYVNA